MALRASQDAREHADARQVRRSLPPVPAPHRAALVGEQEGRGVIRIHSQNLRPDPRTEECPTLLAERMKEAFEKAKAKRQPEPEQS